MSFDEIEVTNVNFDEIIERRGTHCAKWDKMEAVYGVPADSGIAMWVADMDFRPPQVVQDALQAQINHGVHGYFGDDSEYLAAIQWWMENRHGWKVDADAIFTTHGLVNGTAMCVDAFTQPGDGVVLFTPVYHAFPRAINAAPRRVVECPLTNVSGRYEMDFDGLEACAADPRARMLFLCNPHNPVGRVWTKAELARLGAICRKHGVVVVSDEIHGDITFSGHRYTPFASVSEADALNSLTCLSPAK